MDFCNSELIKNNKALSKNKSAKQKCDGSSAVSRQWLCRQPETVLASAQASSTNGSRISKWQSLLPHRDTLTYTDKLTLKGTLPYKHILTYRYIPTHRHTPTHRCTDTQTYTIDALTYRHTHIDTLLHRYTHNTHSQILRYWHIDTAACR